jgi:hypothetical protein
MCNRPASSTPGCKAIIALLVISVLGSGVPLVEIHAHEDVDTGHSHAWAGGADFHDQDELVADESGDHADVAALHVHDCNAPVTSLLPAFEPDVVAMAGPHHYATLPVARPPHTDIAPLYRPPIA